MHGETRGHVQYVPDVGPVALLADYVPYVWIDCEGDCGREWVELLGVTVTTQNLALTSPPVGTAERSWSEVKALYPR